MNTARRFLSHSLVSCAALLLIAGSPLTAYADTVSPAAVQTAPSSASSPSTLPSPAAAASPAPATDPAAGITHPTGAAAATYHYNPSSGLWENDYYTWNAATQETLPKVAPEYTYNPATGLWDTALWQYQPASGQYTLVPVSVLTPPAGSVTHGGPASASASTAAASPAAPQVPSTTAPATTLTAPAAITSAPADQASAAAIPVTDKAAQLSVVSAPVSGPGLSVTAAASAGLRNNLSSAAASGNVTVIGNTTAGNASSGNATNIANIINLLQSSASLAGGNLATFTKNIQGDLSGDILIDPAVLVQPAAATAAVPGSGNVTLASQQSGAIENNINLAATSGNALVQDNTHAGNATSGTANAVANVLNLINSVIAANQSFLGVINIYGNYTGNILVPTDTLNALLASNGPVALGTAAQPPATAAATNSVTTDSKQQIANNVDLSAISGNASLDNNTHAGNATSGDALTRLTILNLTGHEVNAANSLLVFVNVLGQWVGVIMDAPAGTTAAALTGGGNGAAVPANASADTVGGADGGYGSAASGDSRLRLAAANSITNNITASARSGDATAEGNTHVGDATSGRATASANIFNLLDSAFSLSHWFGVLFINVFGVWHGNFGTASAATAGTANTGASGAGATAVPTGNVHVFSFVPGGSQTASLARVTPAGFGSQARYDQFVSQVADTLVARGVVKAASAPRPPAAAVHQAQFSLAALPLVLGLTGFTFVGAERVQAIRRAISGGGR